MIVVTFPYISLVMDAKDAFVMAEIYARCAEYKEKWRSSDEGGSTHHIYPNDQKMEIKVISDDLYNMAKLAGKPEK